MTIQLEHMADGSVADRNFRRLTDFVIDTGGQTIGLRFGATGTINGGANATIAHGLGKTPVAVFTQTANSGVTFGVDTVGASSFRAVNASGTNTTGYWAVIG